MPSAFTTTPASLPSFRLSIRQKPFNSPVARRLISLLDTDLAAFYPDWDDLNHPNVGGTLQPGSDTEADGVVSQQASMASPLPKLREAQKREIVFFVAFARPTILSPTANKDTKTKAEAEKTEPNDTDRGEDRGEEKEGEERGEGEEDGEAIGCAALRPFPPPPRSHPIPGLSPHLSYGEVKRMYVHPSYRGHGVSKALLTTLEQHARDELKLDALVLETGRRQVAARRLYERHGYVQRGEMYAEWVGAGVEDGGDSLCFEKGFCGHLRGEGRENREKRGEVVESDSIQI